MSYLLARLMQPPPMGLILVIWVAFPSVSIHSRIGSSFIAATASRNQWIELKLGALAWNPSFYTYQLRTAGALGERAAEGREKGKIKTLPPSLSPTATRRNDSGWSIFVWIPKGSSKCAPSFLSLKKLIIINLLFFFFKEITVVATAATVEKEKKRVISKMRRKNGTHWEKDGMQKQE